MNIVHRRAVLGVLLAAGLLMVAAPTTTANLDQGGGGGDDILSHFKYGSVGTEARVGLPYWIWRVLPIVFADKLPNRPGKGYERLGFIPEGASHGRPIGTTEHKARINLVGLNCATCHVGTVRAAPGAPRQIVAGMPANQMDLQGYARFLTACANDPRFTASTLLDAIKKENPNFGFFEGLVYRLFAVRQTRDGILERAKENSWFDVRPPQGPGRVDTFNPYKVFLKMPHRERSNGRDRRPAVAVESADPRGTVAALGWQQQLGRGAEQERGDRRRRDARLAGPRVHEADRGLDPRSQTARVSRRAHQRRPGADRRADLPARVRALP